MVRNTEEMLKLVRRTSRSLLRFGGSEVEDHCAGGDSDCAAGHGERHSAGAGPGDGRDCAGADPGRLQPIDHFDVFGGNMASLPLLIYTELMNPEEAGRMRVWGAALTLILLLTVLYVMAAVVIRYLNRRRSR